MTVTIFEQDFRNCNSCAKIETRNAAGVFDESTNAIKRETFSPFR